MTSRSQSRNAGPFDPCAVKPEPHGSKLQSRAAKIPEPQNGGGGGGRRLHFKAPASAAAFRERIEKEEVMCSVDCLDLYQPAGDVPSGAVVCRRAASPATRLKKGCSGQTCGRRAFDKRLLLPTRIFRGKTCPGGLYSPHSAKAHRVRRRFPCVPFLRSMLFYSTDFVFRCDFSISKRYEQSLMVK